MGKHLAMMPLWVGLAAAQVQEVKNPHTTPADIAAGAKIFRSHCAECHGVGGEGGRGSALTSGEFFHGGSDAALMRNISNGIPGTEMPGVFFSPAQVWQIVAYVRSLSESAAREAVAGDAGRGAQLYRGKAGCVACHMIGGDGGRQGPDLSAIGSRRSAAHLRKSILEPGAHVEVEYWVASARTRDGRSLSGFVLNEDTHSIQLLDSQDRLVSLQKAGLSGLSIDKNSRMPSYRGVLADQELTDIVGYLKSLRRQRRSE